MGYNNNHAGIHFLRYNTRRSNSDIQFEQRCEEKELERIHKMMKADKILETNKTKPEENNMKTNAKKSNMKKGKKNSEPKLNMQMLEKYNVPKPGTEMPIEHHFFTDIESVVTSNIFMYAIKNRKDIYSIMSECDQLMLSDQRINPDIFKSKIFWNTVSKQESVFTYLAVLAEKLEINWKDLFVDDKEKRKQFVYELLDYMRDNKISPYFERLWVGEDYFICEDFDVLIGMTTRSSWNILKEMPLYVWKNIESDGKIYYGIDFGRSWINAEKHFHFPSTVANLYSETEGKLKDYIEEQMKYILWNEESDAELEAERNKTQSEK